MLIRSRRCQWLVVIVGGFLLSACRVKDLESELPALESTIPLQSSAFINGGVIPKPHTCDGADRSPALSWNSLPPETQSLVLIADDPDAPGGTFVHWVLYGLTPEIRQLPEGLTPAPQGPRDSRQGKNGFGRLGYRGPCPPSGTHRYFFKLYALDTFVDLEPGASKNQVILAIKDHILAKGELMGQYSR